MSLLPFSSGKVLAVYSDGVVTHGAVFRRKRGEAILLGRARSCQAEPAEALGEILRHLKEAQGIRAPKEAIFASDRAVMLRADLPVDPARPRPYAQMRELARWEAEPGFSELPDWSVEAVLRAREVLSDEEARQVQDETAPGLTPGTMARTAPGTLSAGALSSAGPGAGASMSRQRFQDTALRLGFIDRATRDMAVDTQEQLAEPVTEAACGWAGASDEPASGAQFPWLISAIADPQRQAWVEAFRARKLKLLGLLPGWGLALPEGPALLLERHGGALAAITAGANGIERVQIRDLMAQQANEAGALARILEGTAPERVIACGFDEGMREVIRDHARHAEFREDWPLIALTGLARRQLQGDRTGVPVISLREPGKPLLKNPDFYRVALVGAVVIAIGAHEGYKRWDLSQKQARLAGLEQEFTEKQEIKRQLSAQISKIDQLKEEVSTVEQQIDQLKARERTAFYLQNRRTELPLGILNAVKGAAHPGLVMRSISESEKLSEIYLASAWSVSEVGAETFISDLNRNLARLGLSVADETVYREKGLRGIDGYGVRLRLARTPSGEEEQSQ